MGAVPGSLDLAEDSGDPFVAFLRGKLDIPLWFPVASGETSSHTILESQIGPLFGSLASGSDNQISSTL
jgi:hypothetical protein